MLNIAICDDENYYVQKIKAIIEDLLRKRNVGQYHIDVFLSGTDLCSDVERLKQYQVMFLDINMQEMDGLEVARQVRKINEQVFLVFITAFVDYAVEGYRVEAIRFILKDMLDKMLAECIDTILKKMDFNKNMVEYQFIEGKKKIRIDRICYIESQKHKQIFYIYGKENEMKNFNIYSRLDDIEEGLANYGFIRIHKSFLVNIRYISEIENYKAKLRTGDVLPIPRERYRKIKEHYFEMLGEL